MRWVQLWGSLSILWHCLSLGLEWKLTFSSPVATAEFSKFSGILSAALAQHQCVTFFLSIYLQQKKVFGVLAETNQSSFQETLKKGGQNTLWRWYYVELPYLKDQEIYPSWPLHLWWMFLNWCIPEIQSRFWSSSPTSYNIIIYKANSWWLL